MSFLHGFPCFLSSSALSPRSPPHCCWSGLVPPPYKKGRFAPPDHHSRLDELKPYVQPPGTHSPVRLPLSALPDVLLLVSSLLAMVVAGESWPLPKHAASASTASGKSPPVSASGSAAMKPPVPPAPKPAPSVTVLSASLTPDLVSGEAAQAVPDPPAFPAPAVAPLAPVRPEPGKVARAAVVVPPVALVLADPVITAAPAALGGDLALAAVSATTGGPAPAVVPIEVV
ncbi:unnamed protein product [Closterium sp. NIES-53]